ncbi:hypothetical protein FOA52_002710 [Chlamydomonas sp. UWO 241]|nr:hypothetical protein FOA52_002710 [Chlamydomonas sp. UWO 241]
MLVSKLAAGSRPQLQDQAVAQVGELSLEIGNSDAIVASGAIPALVQLLSSGRHHSTCNAVTTLGNLDGSPTNAHAIVLAGAIPSMVQLLQSSSPELQGRTVGALVALSRAAADFQGDSSRLIAGAISPLTQLLGKGSPPSVQEKSCAALFNLAHSDFLTWYIVSVGAV